MYYKNYSLLSRGGINKLFDNKFYDELMIRDDKYSSEILETLPFINKFNYYICLNFSIVLFHLFFPKFKFKIYKDGYTEFERRLSKTYFFDEIISNSKANQIVYIGSQLDTRSYLFSSSSSSSSSKIYEIDEKQIIKIKKKLFQKKKTRNSEPIFISFSVDQKWKSNLKKKGFNENLNTLFILEETIYSNRNDISIDLIGEISDILAKNSKSRLIFDYFDAKALTIWTLIFILFIRTLIFFGIPGSGSGEENLKSFLGQFSLKVEDHIRLEKLKYGFVVAKNDTSKLRSTSNSKRPKKKRALKKSKINLKIKNFDQRKVTKKKRRKRKFSDFSQISLDLAY